MFKEACVSLLIFCALSVNSEVNIHIQKASFDKAFQGIVLKDKILQRKTDSSLLSCMRMCAKLYICLSFFHNSGIKTCQLHYTVLYESPQGILESGWEYYIMEEAYHPICPGGWKHYNQSCYLFNDIEFKMWEDAKTYCEEKHGMLVEITSQEEQDFIRSVSNSSDSYWLGGYDIDGNDNWVWQSSGQSFQYTAWAHEEPNDYGGNAEQCLGSFAREYYLWNDFECDRDLNFICEKKAS